MPCNLGSLGSRPPPGTSRVFRPSEFHRPATHGAGWASASCRGVVVGALLTGGPLESSAQRAPSRPSRVRKIHPFPASGVRWPGAGFHGGEVGGLLTGEKRGGVSEQRARRDSIMGCRRTGEGANSVRLRRPRKLTEFGLPRPRGWGAAQRGARGQKRPQLY